MELTEWRNGEVQSRHSSPVIRAERVVTGRMFGVPLELADEE